MTDERRVQFNLRVERALLERVQAIAETSTGSIMRTASGVARVALERGLALIESELKQARHARKGKARS